MKYLDQLCSLFVILLWTGLALSVTGKDGLDASLNGPTIVRGQRSLNYLNRIQRRRDLTVVETVDIINELNQLRRIVPGATEVSWDAALEAVVNQWVNYCDLSRPISLNQTSLQGRNIEGFKGISPGTIDIPDELQKIYNGLTNDSVSLCQQLLAPDLQYIGCNSQLCMASSNTLFACIYAYQYPYVPPRSGTSYCSAQQLQTTTPSSDYATNQAQLSRMWWILSIAGSSAIFLLISLSISCMVLCRRRFRLRQDQAAARGEGGSIDSEMAVYSTSGQLDHFPPGFVPVMHPPPYLEGVDGDKPPAYSIEILPTDAQPAAVESVQVPAPPSYRATLGDGTNSAEEPLESENISPPVYDNLAFS